MKAAVLTRVGEIVMVQDWPEPEPTRGEVVVELTGVGLCGSDLAVWSGGRPVELPWIVGHEGIGTIVSVGAGVSDVRIGDRVVIEPNYPCGECPGCLRGRTSMCQDRRSLGMNIPVCCGSASPSPPSSRGRHRTALPSRTWSALSR